jgi:hypothetical protein
LDYLALARLGIHLHIYGNNTDDTYQMIAQDLSPRKARANAPLLGRYLHLHEPLQPSGTSWDEVRRTKSRWVEEFSRYDAGWSYVGRPFPWGPLDDRGAIPNRLGTYLLAGLPIITDRRPGCYRYEDPKRLGVVIELVDSDYDDLRMSLQTEIRTRKKARMARNERTGYSFDASISRLIATLERAHTSYFERPHGERTRFPSGDRPNLVSLGELAPWTYARALFRTPRLARTLRPWIGKK